jgi:hypothetical protein
MEESPTYTAFVGHRRVVAGGLHAILLRAKEHHDRANAALLLIFEDRSGRQVDFDLTGSMGEVLARAAAPSPPVRTGPGRPKLGVVSREVSLLPRHWEWLEQQPHGLSGTLRRLVDEARKRTPAAEQARKAREAAGKVMWSIAGDLPDFEEASRALFACDRVRFEALIETWPPDVRDYAKTLAAPSFVDARRGVPVTA